MVFPDKPNVSILIINDSSKILYLYIVQQDGKNWQVYRKEWSEKNAPSSQLTLEPVHDIQTKTFSITMDVRKPKQYLKLKDFDSFGIKVRRFQVNYEVEKYTPADARLVTILLL